MNSGSDPEIDNEIPITTFNFSHDFFGLETVTTYLIQHDIKDSIFFSLYKVEKELFRITNQRNSQTTTTQYFNLNIN